MSVKLQHAVQVLIDHGRYVSSLPQVSINTQETHRSDDRTTNFEVRSLLRLTNILALVFSQRTGSCLTCRMQLWQS